MTARQKAALERKIIRLVKDDSSSILAIVHRLHWEKPYYSGAEIRGAAWRLVDRGKLELSKDRRIVVRKNELP